MFSSEVDTDRPRRRGPLAGHVGHRCFSDSL